MRESFLIYLRQLAQQWCGWRLRLWLIGFAVALLSISLFPTASARSPQINRHDLSNPPAPLLAQFPLLAPVAPGPCGTLGQQDFSGIPDAPAAIFATQLVKATGNTPEYCQVKGYITPQIQFELQLPTHTWNGRYMQVGCGGYCGSVMASPDSNTALDRNFAVAFDNSGHVGGGMKGGDAIWALDAPQLRRDFGYRSEHLMAIVARAMIQSFYGKPPTYSYLHGCSNGGRQALMEAQRYPNDFDGIIAGAPAAIQAPLNGEYEVWNGLANVDPQGNQILEVGKLALIHQAVLANCDGKDGLVDGQITDPRICTFAPESLQCRNNVNRSTCLTMAEIGVVQKLYGGPVDPQGNHLYPGHEAIGSELGWQGWVVGMPGMPPMAAQIGNGYLKYLAFVKSPSASYSLKEWHFTQEGFDRLREMGNVYNATHADLTAFRDRGGKLILYHGWADPAISPFGTVAYYQAVQDRMGGLSAVQKFARLFMFPGMYHCRGGTGPSDFDMLTPIVAWVEQNTPPDKIIATLRSNDNQSGGFSRPTSGRSNQSERVVRTRPVFPYPMQARYKGQGSIDDAANFIGFTPRDKRLIDGHFSWIGNDLFQASVSSSVTVPRSVKTS